MDTPPRPARPPEGVPQQPLYDAGASQHASQHTSPHHAAPCSERARPTEFEQGAGAVGDRLGIRADAGFDTRFGIREEPSRLQSDRGWSSSDGPPEGTADGSSKGLTERW
ncbi:hypothetical protein FHS38_002128 [Streptomyces netropsis]|uniref:Uncharacterized protein n=1 Tax=Streptomyces netropsis TaxID=55404 RepID=A0A7W7PDK8_STRNE|nr:hypothetical protein [Streptomyces netropsis]GGR16576.1 hypothetical protein GCM10010219_21890 [Streptomyces netropsis]